MLSSLVLRRFEACASLLRVYPQSWCSQLLLHTIPAGSTHRVSATFNQGSYLLLADA